MQNYSKRVLTSLLLTVLTVVFFKTPGLAKDCAAWDQNDPGLMAADIALARPAGAMATVAGLAIFVVSAPFSALGGNSQEAWDSLVASPADYTFKRPLGHFDCE
ncbi:MAG: hypothetical protein NTY00_07555 [Deltaproteobacteria bacterium]|nr:hypothetical protein [Deltaproteobacteria bacterium]